MYESKIVLFSGMPFIIDNGYLKYNEAYLQSVTQGGCVSVNALGTFLNIILDSKLKNTDLILWKNT